MRAVAMMQSQWKAEAKSGGLLHFEDCKGGYFSEIEEYSLQIRGKTYQDRTGMVFGGEAFANAIKTAVPEAEYDVSNKMITYSANKIYGNDIIKGIFKENTLYTIILAGYCNSSLGGYSNLRVYYSDGTFDELNLVGKGEGNKQTGLWVTDAGKTVDCLRGTWADGSTTLFYEECGIFEGVTEIRPIKCVKEGTKIRVYGKNIFDPQQIIEDSNSTNVRIVDNSVMQEWFPNEVITEEYGLRGKTGPDQALYNFYGMGQNILTTSVTWRSVDNRGNALGMNYYFSDGSYQRITSETSNGKALVFNSLASNGKEVVKMSVMGWTHERIAVIYLSQTQIEIGETATEFEPCVRYSEINIPCNLFEGDAYLPVLGLVKRQNGTVEQYTPQPILAPSGTLNIMQRPTELEAVLTATMLCRR